MAGTADPGGSENLRAPRRPWGLRATLYAGFGLIFLLWFGSGLDLVRRMGLVEERAGAVSARSAAVDEDLATVRVRMLAASVFLRDAILDVRPDAGPYYGDQLEQARDEIQRVLDAYVPVSPSPDERRSVEQLKAEIHGFWETVLPIFRLEVRSRSDEVNALLRDQIVPKRRLIFEIVDRVQELNRVALRQEQAELRRLYSRMRRQILLTGGLALFASLLVAWAVTRHASTLERRIREQMLKDAESTRDLQRLSAMLVNAQEEERRSIARELHDEVGQALTAIKVELSVAARNAALTEREDAALQDARKLTDRTLQIVRDLSQLLHPAMLDDLGLPDAIAWHLNAFSTRTGIRTDFVQDQVTDRLAGEIETCQYRIVQEALTNVARHAEARSCRVYLQRLPRSILLTVEDDGKGFPPRSSEGATPPRGLGLLGIEERVAGFRGSFQVETAPGKGTRLTVELPALVRQQPPDEIHDQACRLVQREVT